MRPKYLLLLIGLTIFKSCISQKNPQDIENALGERIFTKFSGTAYIKPTSTNSFLILVNTKKSSDSYDKAIVVFVENKPIINEIDEESIYHFFIPENKRYIAIFNQSRNRIFLAGLTDQIAQNAILKFKANPSIKSSLTNRDIFGYGLAFLSGVWNIGKVKSSEYKQPYNTLDYANMTNEQAALLLPPVEDEETGGVSCAQGTCTSGGAGSSSCSITEAPLEQSCTVTCNTGYYACCVSSTVRCYCCKI